MCEQMKKIFSPLILATLLGISLVMFYFVWLMPYMTDNYLFSKDMTPGYAAFMGGEQITSLKPMSLDAAFRQAREMYSSWCGRFAGNLFVYLLFMLPHGLYAAFAAFGFALLVLLLHCCIHGREWKNRLSPAWLLGIAGLLWAGLPSFGSAFFWLSVGGEIALLAQAAILLPYRLAFDRQTERTRLATIVSCLIFFPAGIVSASLDYATSCALPPTALLCVVWLYFRQKPGSRKAPAMLISGALGLFFGGGMTILAPGNYQRLRLTSDPDVLKYLDASWTQRIADWLSHLPEVIVMQSIPICIFLWSCLVLKHHYGACWIKRVPKSCLLFIIPAFLTVGAYLFTAWPPPRAFSTPCMQMIVAACIVLAAALPEAGKVARYWLRIMRLALCLFCVTSLVVEAFCFVKVHNEDEWRKDIYKVSKGKDVVIPPLGIRGDKFMVLGEHLNDVSPDPGHFVNRAIAANYGLKSLRTALPEGTFSGSGECAEGWLFRLRNGYLYADEIPAAVDRDRDELHFYYYGAPALLSKLPAMLADAIFEWLADSGENGLKANLLPLLLAREDMSLKRCGKGDEPCPADLLEMYPANGMNLWLVRPGEDRTSFDICKLRHMGRNH